ncbi:hypothetical protein ACGYTQ_10335 [Burkholderia pseudomallei]|uniref:hypothetical protein n=1 Tax=Burkholderia pseudomallei TaxID=28450 RepID=UPI00039D3D6D|nr:hypothetical protein [Burkholderia pseudomallei]ALB94506.1 hypothetical protein AM256_13415 [Burkholderia pseudomallei]ALC00580.1 hypothetical protein AM257_13440 [Burkholderia pseudomallei]MBF3451143.1 hypothetical protein [Burkholderia pseudomallei]MBF3475498.1 hypothetical protein [Burkholderia pseudomallei]MBF3511205.1 hypothetical protein [Burkholderia pseudomallei]
MAQRHDASFFDRLIAPMLRHLRHIAGLTKGEQTVDELKAEAWIIAQEIQAKRGELEPEDEDLQQTIVKRLHQAFGRFVNRAMRFAVRLDHEERDDDGEFRENSVASRLASPEHYEPQAVTQIKEEAAETARVVAAQFSEAVAYYCMFDQFDGDSSAVAFHFAITAGTLRRRLTQVKRAAREQPSIFDGVTTISPNFMGRPGTWRRRQAPNPFIRVCASMRPSQAHLFLRFGKVFGPLPKRPLRHNETTMPASG